MEGIVAAHEALEKKGNLNKAVDDVQKLIDILQSTSDAITQDPERTALHLAKLRTPVKQSFDKIEDDLKEVNKGLNHYSKALKDKFKNAALPTVQNDALSSQPELINRAIAMHLLREGRFGVVGTFVQESNASYLPVDQNKGKSAEQDFRQGANMEQMILNIASEIPSSTQSKDPDAMEVVDDKKAKKEELERREQVHEKFAEMYNVLDALRNKHDLHPALYWARRHSKELETRGSNLEFELARLEFIEQYTNELQNGLSDQPYAGPLKALEYARAYFPLFASRYSRETSSLLGSLAFSPALDSSPYKSLFYNRDAWEEVSASFTREFCGMLGLSSQSPLYTAVTAGGIALPILEKVERAMSKIKVQWTSAHELPVETPLPPDMSFHSIFVCPVSKDQATDDNPPMMMTCGHVIAKESLEAHSRGKSKMKCPYCPNESHSREAKRIYI